MKFQRTLRYDPVSFSERKIAAFERKKKKELERYPLLANEIASTQRSIDEEINHREHMLRRSEQRMRDLTARHWRQARSNYFASSPDVRAAIRAYWDAWTGPRNAVNFSYVVDCHTGAMDARCKAVRTRHEAIRLEVLAAIPVQVPFELPAER